MKRLLKNGLVYDPENELQAKYDILISEKEIIRVHENITESDIMAEGTKSKNDTMTGNVNKRENNNDELEIIDLEGKIVLPGLIDIHTHLREPGFEEKETIKSGCEAAAAGGFTAVACMANTNPVVDNPATVEFINSRAREAVVKVFPVGSITKGMKGEELSEIGFMAREGVRALSEDGSSVKNSEIMRRAMEYAASFGMTIIDHCEDEDLAGEGVMNEGYYSTLLGLEPIPAVAEEIVLARDLKLVELTGCPLHIAHLSTSGGVELLAGAKEKGLPVTAEVTPHHLVLTEEAVRGYDPNTKVNPPLRSNKDRQVLREALKEGIIDVVATDHAPHTYEDKLGEYDLAANGISGLETALSLIYDKLIKEDLMDWERIVEAMVYKPAQIIKRDISGIQSGAQADLTIFDPDKKWTVKPEKFKSKGRNTPFVGQKLTGKTMLTLVDGQIVYDDRSGKNEIVY